MIDLINYQYNNNNKIVIKISDTYTISADNIEDFKRKFKIKKYPLKLA